MAPQLTLETDLSADIILSSMDRLIAGEPAQRVLNSQASADVRRKLLGIICRIDAFRSVAKHQEFAVEFFAADSAVLVDFAAKRPALASANEPNNKTAKAAPTAASGQARKSPASTSSIASLREACSLLGLPEDLVSDGAAADALRRAQAAASWADELADGEAGSAESIPETPARGTVRATSKRARDEDARPSDLLSSPPARDCPMSAQRTDQQSSRFRPSMAHRM